MITAGSQTDFLPLLEAAWASLLAAIQVQAFPGLSQSCIAKLLLQPIAAALRHRSAAIHDAAEEFWSSSGIQAALQGCDVGLVEEALAHAGSQQSLQAKTGFSHRSVIDPQRQASAA